MSRRAVVAAGLVAVALTVGIVRTVAHDQQDPPATAPPVVTPAPTVLAAPSMSTISTASTSPSVATGAEPVTEGADGSDASAGVGSDAGPDGDAAAAADRRYWEPVADGFGRAFTTVRRGDTTADWQARLRPYVTVAVDKQLATVDVANVPQGRFDGLDVLDSSDEQVTVQATYSPGWALVLYLNSDGHDHWKVYNYDRLEQ